MNTDKNAYIKTALYFLGRAANCIRLDMSNEHVYDATLLFGIGVERLCHAILHDINPAFVIEGYTTELAVQLGHASKDPKQKGGPYPSKKAFVVSLASALSLAKNASPTIKKFETTLNNLKDYRNIIAHRCLDELKVQDALGLCQIMFIEVVAGFASELEFDTEALFPAERHIELWSIHDEVQEQARYHTDLEALKNNALKVWNETKANKARCDEALKDTRAELDKLGATTWTNCPICENEAVLSYTGMSIGPPLTPDSPFFREGHLGPGTAIYQGGPTVGYQRGVGPNPEVTEIRCYFCGLHLTADKDARVMDELQVQTSLDIQQLIDRSPYSMHRLLSAQMNQRE